MMSLSRVSIGDIVKKQYQFKLKSYIGFFSSLIVLQLLAILFSLGGVGGSGRGGPYLEINIRYYSADYVVIFTMIWSFIISIQMMFKEHREDDYTFVTNRLASHLSNAAFLLTVSIISGGLAILSGFLLKVISYFVLNYSHVVGTGLAADLQTLFKGLLSTILFIFVFSMLGYLVGTLVQLSKMFIPLLPVLFFGFVFMSARAGEAGESNIFSWIFQFYFQESVFLLFFIKMIFTSGLIFLCVLLLSSRLEVRS